MAAPAYTWSWVTNLFGITEPPKVASLEASSGLYTVPGTLVVMASGQVDEATASVVLPIGLAAETINNATAADPVKVYILRPGDVLKGTADADATTLAGFNGKTTDFNPDGSLDVGDTSNGCAAVHRVEDAGLTVYITLTKLATF